MPALTLKDPITLQLSCPVALRQQAKISGPFRWDPTSRAWLYPLSEDIVKRIIRNFGQIDVDPQIFQALINQRQQQFESCRIKLEKDTNLPPIPLKTPLWEFQKTGVKFLLSQDRLANFDEMGLGKTLQALALMIARKRNDGLTGCLIIAPKTWKDGWAEEIKKRTYESSLVVRGDKEARIKIYKEYLRSKILFLIMGYETLRQDWILLSNLKLLRNRKLAQNSGKIDAVILDECQKIKNRKSQIGRIIHSIEARFATLLTGTPILNRPEDIWNPIEFLRPGFLAPNYWAFEDEYIIKGGFNNKQIIGYKNLDKLKRKLDSISIRRTKDEVLDLPPKVYTKISVELEDPHQREAYNEMRERLRVELEDLNKETVTVRATSIFTQFLRLTQITNGFLYDPKVQKKPKYFRSSKFQAIEDFLKEYISDSRKLVVWTNWLPCLFYLEDKYKKRFNAVTLWGGLPEEARTTNIQRFQTGDAQLLIGQIRTGSLGISLTAADTQIIIDKAMISPAVIRQAEDRLHRKGQSQSVTIISLVCRNTIDEHWERLLQKKQNWINEILQARKLDKQFFLDLLGD